MQAYPLKSFAFMELAALAVLVLLGFCYVENAGVFSRHMIIHIALMTVAAPVLASLLLKLSSKSASVSTLFAAVTLQAALLFAWHSPLGIGLAMKGHAGTLLMQATLFFSALWFWLTVFNQTGEHLWRAVIALLLTGKLFCLMAVLLIFAPRVLYSMTAINMPIELADQQLAGLLMVTVCPITYVLAAVVLISRWFQTLSDTQSNVTSTAVAAENSSWQSR
ncbi:cytochrome c oxidase assembly protein [Methylobacter tundripaludum]|uniref:Cytochrome c oxidase caa3-type protein n=1 Tax=Methylobacter tundripaludum (strain ATCC BAA-1195 / DSM 17260 / SV96) TaxID=697282 RepID=G3ITX9_METTV|nr:cytochrome c oxidase assembly protein [Methylobacter tundripaludum]EGW21462.1 Cytochrome c oxidase caa3-type protein [Methylobacter tundripaludum SV96]